MTAHAQKLSRLKQHLLSITKHEVHTTFIRLLTSTIANERQSEPCRYADVKLKQDARLSYYSKIPTMQKSCYSVIGDKPFLWNKPKFDPP